MHTIVKKEDLDTIFNINTDSIHYKGEKFTFDKTTLDKYFQNPGKYNLLTSSTNQEENFYKNLALYIINSDDNFKVIELDLDKDFIIKNGIFEFFKNIYQDKKEYYVLLDNNVNNNLFIKTKKLKHVDIEHGIYAQDIELGGKNSILENNQKIVENNNFFWKSESLGEQAGVSNIEYIIGKLAAVASTVTYSDSTHNGDKNELADKEFYNILSNSDQKLVQSTKFKLTLLEEDNSAINNVLVRGHHQDIFKIDFREKSIFNFLKKQAKNNNFNLISRIFTHNITANEQNNYAWMREAIENGERNALTVHDVDFYGFANIESTITYLLNNSRPVLDTWGEDKNFSITSIYRYLSEENKKRRDVVESFLQNITQRDRGYHGKYHERRLKQLPLSLYNERYFLDKVKDHLDYSDLKKEVASGIKYQYFSPTLLVDKDYMLESAENMQSDKFLSWIANFLPKADIDKDFLLKVLEKNPSFYYMVTDSNFLKDFKADPDLLFTAASRGYNVKKLPKNVMKTCLLLNENPERELVKLRYVIEYDDFHPINEMFKTVSDKKQFEAKFRKSEYVYLSQKDNWHRVRINTKEIQQQLSSTEEVLQVLETIEQLKNKYSYEFHSKLFYEELPKNLQDKKEVVDKLLNIVHEPFKFETLSPILQYNSDLALKFIELDPQNTLKIPQEFFNDISFSLAFAKLMDKGIFRNKESLIPSFITKFFDTQEVTEDYYEKLSQYINYFKLKESTDKKPTVAGRKNKL